MASNSCIKKADKIKDLEKRIEKTSKKLEDMRSDISLKTRESSLLANEIKNLKERKQALLPREFRISDHAIVRYFERILNYDIEDIRKQIINELNNNNDTVCGFKTKIENNTLITILPVK